MLHIDPITDLARILADAVMQPRTPDVFSLGLVKDAIHGILPEIELPAEHPDKADHPIQLPRLLPGPGDPGPQMVKTPGDGGMYHPGIARLITPDHQPLRLDPIGLC